VPNGAIGEEKKEDLVGFYGFFWVFDLEFTTA
jgi:hypothetical protein